MARLAIHPPELEDARSIGYNHEETFEESYRCHTVLGHEGLSNGR